MVALLTATAGIVLLAPVAVLVPAALRFGGVATFFVAALTASASEIVLLTVALSLVHALQPGWMLLGQLAGAIGSIAAWTAGGRPRPPAVRLPRVRSCDSSRASTPPRRGRWRARRRRWR